MNKLLSTLLAGAAAPLLNGVAFAADVEHYSIGPTRSAPCELDAPRCSAGTGGPSSSFRTFIAEFD